MPPRSLVVALALLGILLTVTAVPAPFSVDENNYLVTAVGLRQGRLTVPGTENLPPSRELLYFDAAPSRRMVASTPVASVAPPLYAVIALPFSFLGWRGLVALNTLALLATIVIAFFLARRFATGVEAPWIAACAVGGASYFYDYGQSVWPHMVSVALMTAAVYFAARALVERPGVFGLTAGFCAAIATGVRYQNAFMLGCLGLGLLLFARRRLAAAMALGLGALAPLVASSAINHISLDSWNPISKGSGYLHNVVNAVPRSAGSGGGRGVLHDFSTMAWARIVDYSAAPSLAGTVHESYHAPHPESGAYVMVTAVKKAWLQSSPWMIVALLFLAAAWMPARWWERVMESAPQLQLRFLSLIVFSTLAMFSASGVGRTDGLCFNQRYFCELVPLVAVAFAWAVEGVARRRTALLGGALVGVVLVFVSLQPNHLTAIRHYALMYLPLALAVFLGAAWLHARARGWTASLHSSSSAVLAVIVGAALAWGTAVHLGDDVPATRILRKMRAQQLAQLRPHLPDHSALFVSRSIMDAVGPLALDLDVVIAVPSFDRGETAARLLDAFLAQDRRVFLHPDALSKNRFDEVLAGRRVRLLGEPPLLIEVGGT